MGMELDSLPGILESSLPAPKLSETDCDSASRTFARPNATLNRLPDGIYRGFGKRLFDVAICFAIMPIVLPIIAILAAVISLEGGRPIFAQERVGERGRRFYCLKLRSMATDAEMRLRDLLATDAEAAAEWAGSQKLLDDPRVTRLGRFLRKSSLDELPQIWNVLRGDMSIVGPRPVVPDELDRYGMHVNSYLRARPGITGAWQASGRNNVIYEERVRIDVEYERRITFLRDVQIIVRTGWAVFASTGY